MLMDYARLMKRNAMIAWLARKTAPYKPLRNQMRSVAILGDIHGNLEALQAALLKVRHIKFDKHIVLGDLVGYGASPNEVVKLIRKMEPVIAVRGNHDKVAAGISDGRDFNYAAREAALWTRSQLSPGNRDYIDRMNSNG